MPYMQLQRGHYIVLCFLGVYIPFSILLYSVRYKTQEASTRGELDLIVVYILFITASLIWATFALALHPCVILSRIVAHDGVTHAKDPNAHYLFII